MPSRWESSQRPLFVQSVWMDGYRHAILSKEDPVVKLRSPQSSNRKTKDSQRRESQSQSVCDGLVIPTVKLLFVNVQHVNSKQRPKIQPDRKIVKSITFNVITQTRQSTNVNLHVDLTPTTKTVPASHQHSTSENKINIERIEQCSNSLTERVLLWLDLAGRYTSEIHKNMQEEKQLRARNVRKQVKRVGTAHPVVTDQQTVRDEVAFKSEPYDLSALVQLKDIMEEYSVLNNQRKKIEQIHTDLVKKNSLINSEQEIFSDVKMIQQKSISLNGYPPSFSKRQVHIFMPLLTKKNADNCSVLSDNVSSLS